MLLGQRVCGSVRARLKQATLDRRGALKYGYIIRRSSAGDVVGQILKKRMAGRVRNLYSVGDGAAASYHDCRDSRVMLVRLDRFESLLSAESP